MAWNSINCPSSLLTVNLKAKIGLEEYGCYPLLDLMDNKIYAHATLRSIGVGLDCYGIFQSCCPPGTFTVTNC